MYKVTSYRYKIIMKRSLLIINDITTYGRVSSFAMYPIFAYYGLHPYFLPTAIVSNTLDYGSAEILDTSEWMSRTIAKWREHGFAFDTIATGLVNSEEQVSIISDLIAEHNPSLVIVDPIMADSGQLYPDMYKSVIECNRRLAAKADILLPNYTEACLLSNIFHDKDVLEDIDNEVLLSKLYELGCQSIVVKGCKDVSGNKYNLVSNGISLPYTKEYYEEIDTSFIGTGDVFSAVLISEIYTGTALVDAVNTAAKTVRDIIIKNIDNEDHYDLDIESYLQDIFN